MPAFEAIASSTLGTATSTVTFSSIPGTYEHLQLRCYARSTGNTQYTHIQTRYNSSSSSIYDDHYLYGNGSGAVVDAGTGQTFHYLFRIPGSTAASNCFGVYVVDILDYASTNKNKVTRLISGWNQNTTVGEVWFTSHNWRSTSAITSIELVSGDTNFAVGSVFSLYGLRSS